MCCGGVYKCAGECINVLWGECINVLWGGVYKCAVGGSV